MQMENKKENIYRSILACAFIILVIFLIVRYWDTIRGLNIHNLRMYILSYGSFAALCFILIYSLKPIVFIVPASLLSILAGNLFGPLYGLALSIISCFFAGSLAFFLAKGLGKPFVDKLLRGKAITFNDNFEKHGFKIMLIMRLSVIFPYDELSYAAGLTRMKYWDFISATLLGVLPEMTCYSLMGDNIQKPFSLKFMLPIALTVAIAFIAFSMYKKNKNNDKKIN